MIELELKFGFLTNYDYTYFLKREIIDDTEVIYCSPPVSHKASPFHTGGVSIRQCMLLLQSSVLGDESRWKVPKASNIGIVKQEYREKRGAAKLRATETILSLAQGIPVPEWDDETVDAVKSPSLDGRSKRVRSLSFDHRSSKRVKFDIPSRRPGLRSDSQKAERK